MDYDNIISRLSEIKKNSSFKEMKDFLSSNNIDIVNVGERNLGRCYNAYNMEIRSKELLPITFVKSLRQLGLIGYGQEYSIGESYPSNDKFIIRVVDFVDSSD